MELIIIVGGFLLPVIMVFGYSIWRSRQRKKAMAARSANEAENKTS
jgi:predicted negative regulator of RcsB-dependent stress response